MNKLLKEFSNLRVLRRKSLNYLDIPFFNHSKATDPQVLAEAVEAIAGVIDLRNAKVTKLVSEEEYGGFLTACVSLKVGIPFSLAKQDSIHSINGIGVTFAMAYNKKMTLHLNGIKKGDRVVIIDDIIDTGGTIIALIHALQKAKVKIVSVIALLEKVDGKGVARIKKETGLDAKTLIQLDCSGRRSKIVSSVFDGKKNAL